MIMLAACPGKGKAPRAESNYQEVIWEDCTIEYAQVRVKCCRKVSGAWQYYRTRALD